jgi:hypothetical protein
VRPYSVPRGSGRGTTVVELDWTVVVAVSRSKWPWPWINLQKYTVRALRPEIAEREACKLAQAQGYEVVNAIAASCT